MPARNRIATYVYDSQDSHHKFDIAKGTKTGTHSVTTTIKNIIWPSEPETTTESVTTTIKNIIWPSEPETKAESTTIDPWLVMNETSTDVEITTETITQLSTTIASEINTLNLNNTVIDVITNGTQDAMVNVVNNAVNVTNEISSSTTSASVIQNAINSTMNLVETTSSTVTASANVTNQVPINVTLESTSATMVNVVKNTTTLVTDTISTTTRNIGFEYFNDHENEGSKTGTNALLVLILLVLIFIGAFLIYIYLRHRKLGKTQNEYKVNQHEESPTTTELQHEQIEIENESYVQHTVT